MVRLKVIARIIPEDVYLAHIESSIKPNIFPEEKKFAIVVKEPGSWKVETLATAIEDKYLSLYKFKLGGIKYLKDDANDCDLDPEDTLSDALIDEGKAQVDNSDQHVKITVITKQQDGLTSTSIAAVSYTPARPSILQSNVPRFEDMESPLGKRKRVPSVEKEDHEKGEQRSAQRRKRNSRMLQRTKRSMTNLGATSQPPQLASPTPSSITNNDTSRTEVVHSIASQAPPPAAQPLTWHLNQARNMQLSLKDLNRVITADSASNSTINSPAIDADKKPFQQATRPLFGADDDDSDESSDESSDDEPAEKKSIANGSSKIVLTGQGRGLPLLDPTIRDATDDEEDDDSD